MDCVTYEGKVVRTRLLTQAEKIRKLVELFADRHRNSDLFLPDDNFYGINVSADDPERMADALFKWLGIKHRSIVFHVDPEQEKLIVYTHRKNGSQLSLGLPALEDPLLCAALVAHGIVHHLLLARAKVSLIDSVENETLCDLGTIYAGFGVLILNSFGTKHPVIGSMGIHNYANEFMDYCSQERIVKSVWEPYVLPSVASDYLETKAALRTLKPYLRARLKKTRNRKTRIVAVCTILSTVIALVSIVQISSPRGLSTEMLEKQEAVMLLKNQYQQCLDLVAYKQERWDQSDIFIQRQIESDKTRCASLQNRYNYELGELNANF